jgi:hypothetical protein
MDEIKLCKDCKHAKKSLLFGYEFARCTVSIKNRATGEGWYCRVEREFPSNVCGPSGKAFEPKPRPWYAFWRVANKARA